MKFAWIFALVPFCLGRITDENCMDLVPDFVSQTPGSDLRLCTSTGQQCCSQLNEDELGMTLNNAIRYNHTLGIELQELQTNARAFYTALSYLRISLINDVLRPLMNSSADLTIGSPQQFIDDLDRIRGEALYNINATIAGSLDANLTAELMKFFTDGLSVLYYNASFEGLVIGDEERMCAINDIFMHFFPSMEQTEIASLGRKLQQIKVAYDVARTVLSSVQRVLTSLENFNTSYTCTNVWTQQYACPRCAGQAAPLCQGRCNEVLIGCMSSLQQMIVQLNVLLDFTRGSVNSLLSGNPFSNINVNNITDDYMNIFSTIVTRDRDYITLVVPGTCAFTKKRKRSIDSPIVRHKRQDNTIVITFPTVTINQSIVTMINDTLLPAVVNVSLNSDRMGLCEYLMANGQGNCTIGIGNVGTYTPSNIGLEISDQVDNPTGPFNLTQLREQARPLPYVMTELLMNRSDIMMLYNYTLPERPVPNLDFLDTTIATTVTTVTTTTTDTIGITPTTTTAATDTTDTIGTTATPSTTDIPAATPPDGGGTTAISYSLFITLAALLVASVL